MTGALAERLVEQVHREGPLPFDRFVDLALYSEDGFFSRGRGAGRAGRDFVTSPEVGPLFGALVARFLDGRWRAAGEPDPFFVVDAGAGRGRLAADVLAAAPACARALRYVLVERSATLREAQRDLVALEPFEDALGPALHTDDDRAPEVVAGMGPIATSIPELPAVPLPGVVLANELLDNLPFRIVERADGGWHELRVGVDGGRFVETLVPASPELSVEADQVACDRAALGARVPVPTSLGAWLQACAAVARHGVLVVVDYAATAAELAERGMTGWLRTYRDHGRGGSPLDAPGEQDLTIDVPVEYLVHCAARTGFVLVEHTTQAQWLAAAGLDELVADARAAWDARAHVGDLEAVRQRSRVTEAAALADPGGLGAHQVFVFRRS